MRYWRRLDNAAKIFPSASGGHDTNVFRVYCELLEEVDPNCLQVALDKTMEDFPVYRSVMKKGVFWYYLEDSDIRPIVRSESGAPCKSIYDVNVRKLLFEVSYFENRINFEVYHVLADGTGALQFLRVLVANYILAKYGVKASDFSFDVDGSVYQKADDSYKKYYESDKKKNSRVKFAYKVTGTRTLDRRLKVIEGLMSSSDVLDRAHKYEATVTAFIVGVLLKAIFEEMAVSDFKRPVVVAVPVNLRKFFESSSMRNFFGVVYVSYDFSRMSSSLDDIIKYVNGVLKEELDKDKIKLRMNSLIGVERNALIRVVPLFIKNFVLNIAYRLAEAEETTTVSNIGRVNMPEVFSKYISSFGMFVSTNKIQMGVCSYNDSLTVSFSSAFINTDVERRFFRTITDMGIKVKITSNIVNE